MTNSRAAASLASGLSNAQWVELTQIRMHLSAQQGVIARFMLTLPHDGNSNLGIALAMTRERRARYGRRGITTASGRIKPGTGPVTVETVDKQVERMFARIGVHSRMEFAQRVDAEVCVMRGWMKGPT